MIRESTGLESEFLNSGLDMLFIMHLLLGKSLGSSFSGSKERFGLDT